MKITAEPKRVDNLLRFLRDGGYAAREAGFGIVAIDDLLDTGRPAAKLASELALWGAVNRSRAQLVTSDGSADRRVLRRRAGRRPGRHAPCDTRPSS